MNSVALRLNLICRLYLWAIFFLLVFLAARQLNEIFFKESVPMDLVQSAILVFTLFFSWLLSFALFDDRVGELQDESLNLFDPFGKDRKIDRDKILSVRHRRTLFIGHIVRVEYESVEGDREMLMIAVRSSDARVLIETLHRTETKAA